MKQEPNQTDARGNELNPVLPPVFESINFEREKVRVMKRISKEMITDVKLSLHQTNDDFIYDTLHAELSAFIYSSLTEERELVYWSERPKFFDWLFRRKKIVVFHLQVKDIMLNPPKIKNTARIYNVVAPSQNWR